AYLGVPIIVGDTVIGFLNLDGFTPGMFGAEQAVRVRAFADQAAIAIRNAQLFEAEQRRRRSAETLAQASATINATLDLPQVLDRILQQFRAVVAYDSASVMEIDESDLVIMACHGFSKPEEVIAQRFPVGPTIPAIHVIEERRSFTFADVVQEFPPFHDHDVTDESSLIRSWMGVPLLIKDRVIGVITVDRFTVQPFTADDVALALALANQAALAIENARLYEQVQRYASELEQRVANRTADLRQEMAERERTAAALLASEERYRIVSEMISDYIYSVIVHPDGTMETSMMSGVIERITGYTAEEMRVLTWNTIVHPDDLADIVIVWWPRVMAGQTTAFEYRITTKDGETRWLRDYQKPVWVDEAGRVMLVWGAVQDITELRRQMQLIEAANDELRALGQIKDEFVSNVSHELRTPITSLKLRQDLLDVQPDRMAVHLDVMRRETDRLARTIEDLLQLSRMDQGHSVIALMPVDLNVLARQYATDRAALAEADGLQLQAHDAPGASLVEADEGLLGQALSILLTNALHYTPPGGQVLLRVLVDRDADLPRVGIAVADTGPGIPPDEQEHLFERFFRGTVGRQSGKPGTGLGLAILKGIVDRHGGEVVVDSTGIPGAGATFTIWLPALVDVPESAN
ncbi:MAG: GAF domain-containing protein, partial [Anaerolineae bacterium]|nr:GAF domain-containing protein [Anaerolineae bacterium]